MLSLIFLILCIQPLIASWSEPPLVIYPSSAPYSARNPSIATDSHGNSIVVWFDTSGTGSMLAATHTAGSVNGMGQPVWVSTNPISTSNVQAPSNPASQAVGFDASGNALAVWTDGIYIYSSSLLAGQTTWLTPKTVNMPLEGQTADNLSLAVAPNGRATVTWVMSFKPTGTYSVFTPLAASYAGIGWEQTSLLFDGEYQFNNKVNPVAVDLNGNATVGVTGVSGTQQAVVYRAGANFYTILQTDPVSNIYSTSVAVDRTGNAIIVWVEATGIVKAVTIPFITTLYPFQPVTVNPQMTLSSAADLSSFPRVLTDSAGNAVAVWTDVSGNLGSARYSFNSQNWTGLPLLDLGGDVATNISLSGDTNGNMVASWTLVKTRTSIQTATLLAAGSSWGSAAELSQCPYSNDNTQISLTADGDALILWQNNIDSGTRGTILSSIFLNNVAAESSPSP
jgi:hypothetical protein